MSNYDEELESMNDTDSKEMKIVAKVSYKITRDLSRIVWLLKDQDKSAEYEYAAQELFNFANNFTPSEAEEESKVSPSEKKHWYDGAFPVVNMKAFKLLFNRAYRMKGESPKQAIILLKYLLDQLHSLLGKEGTFYESKILFELVRCNVSLGQYEEAEELLNKAREIIVTQFGESSSLMLDYLMAEIEFM